LFGKLQRPAKVGEHSARWKLESRTRLKSGISRTLDDDPTKVQSLRKEASDKLAGWNAARGGLEFILPRARPAGTVSADFPAKHGKRINSLIPRIN